MITLEYAMEEEAKTAVVTVSGRRGGWGGDEPVHLQLTIHDTLEGHLGRSIGIDYAGDAPGTGFNRSEFHAFWDLSIAEMQQLHRMLGRALREAKARVAAGDWC